MEPTEEGKKRHPPNGIYDSEYACTCIPTCANPCKGGCGCKACDTAYQDFLSTE